MATIASLSVAVDAKTSTYHRKMRGVDRSVEESRKNLRRFATVAATTTAAVTGVAVAMTKLTKRGGEVIGVQRAFARATGDVTGSLRQLRSATIGVISDYELMAGLNRALALGSAQNVDEFEELARAGQALGRALGVDAAHAVESLNLGIGRQSRLILDNLGLIVSVEEANRKYAETLGVQVDQLTQAQRREAFRAEALEKARQKVEELGGVTQTAADSWGRFATAIGNVTDALAKVVAQSGPLATFFDTMATGLDNIRDKLQSEEGLLLFTPLGNFRLGAGGDLGGAAQAGGGASNFAEQVLDPLVVTVDRMEEETGRAVDALAEFAPTLDQVITDIEFRAADSFQAVDDLTRRIQSGEVAPSARGSLSGAVAGAPAPEFKGQGAAGLQDIVGLGSFDPITLDIKNAAREMEGVGDKANQAAQVAIAGFGGVVEAFARGSAQMEQVVVSAFTNILQNIPGVGGFAGAVIGAVGGLVGGLLSRANRPAPVRVEDYSSQAQRKMKDANQQPVIRNVLAFPDGTEREITDEELREIGFRLGRLHRKGGLPRD